MTVRTQYLIAALIALMVVICLGPFIGMLASFIPGGIWSSLLVFGAAWLGGTILVKLFIESIVRLTESGKPPGPVAGAAASAPTSPPAIAPPPRPLTAFFKPALRSSVPIWGVFAILELGQRGYQFITLVRHRDMAVSFSSQLVMLTFVALIDIIPYLVAMFFVIQTGAALWCRRRAQGPAPGIRPLRLLFAQLTSLAAIAFIAYTNTIFSLLGIFGVLFTNFPVCFLCALFGLVLARTAVTGRVIAAARLRLGLGLGVAFIAAFALIGSGPSFLALGDLWLLIIVAFFLAAVGYLLTLRVGLADRLPRREKALYLAALVLLGACFFSRDADGVVLGTYNLKGLVRLRDATDHAGVTVSLLVPGRGRLGQCVTGSSGDYAFTAIRGSVPLREYIAELPSGCLTVHGYRPSLRFEKPGYETAETRVDGMTRPTASDSSPYWHLGETTLYRETSPIGRDAQPPSSLKNWRAEYLSVTRHGGSSMMDDESRRWEEYLIKYPTVPIRDEIEYRLLAARFAEYRNRFYLGNQSRVDNYLRVLAGIEAWRATYPKSDQLRAVLVLEARIRKLIPDPIGYDRVVRELNDHYPGPDWTAEIGADTADAHR